MNLPFPSFTTSRRRGTDTEEVLLAFIQSWNRHGRDETSICSASLDILRAFLGERPSCVWKMAEGRVVKISERGVVELLASRKGGGQEALLAKTLTSGQTEFEALPEENFRPEISRTYDGFLYVPIKLKDQLWGILMTSTTRSEARSKGFVEPLESLGKLMAIAIHQAEEADESLEKERRLRAEVESTTRELAQTNERLIERVRELKTLSKELERRVEELTHANKAKDEFLSIVSHELRTPLTSINGFLAVLLEEEAGPITDAQKKFLSIAKQSADRLNVLISDLLDISRIESGRMNLEFVPCSLFEILRKSVEGLEKSAKAKSISVEFNSSPNLPQVWADAHRIQQVVDNILSNAIKFTQLNGRVVVTSNDMGDGIQVSIQDTGPGISEDERRRIFDMFYQVDASSRRSAGGAGLGLAIANGIVSMHGGRLWVDSEVGSGTTFFFIIPRNKNRKAA